MLIKLILVSLFWVSALFSQVEISSEAMHKELKSFKQRFDQDSQVNYDDLYLEKLEQIGLLGFRNIPQVKLAAKYKKTLADLKQVGKYINIYAKKYPGYPFLTKEEIERIAEKYTLILGEVSIFKRDIPAINIDELLKFDNNLSMEDWSDWHKITYFAMAPLDQFDMTDRIVDGIYIIKDDPIIFARVNGGYLLVTYWGNDAIKPMQEIEKFVKKSSIYSIEKTIEAHILTFNGSRSWIVTGNITDHAFSDSVAVRVWPSTSTGTITTTLQNIETF